MMQIFYPPLLVPTDDFHPDQLLPSELLDGKFLIHPSTFISWHSMLREIFPSFPLIYSCIYPLIWKIFMGMHYVLRTVQFPGVQR